MKKGFLITIEGIDGSGKTTLIKNLQKLLIKHKLQIIWTKEPGATLLGLKLRKSLLKKDFPICDKAEFLLFAADRAEHFSEIIIPNLEQGNIIISDRMADSSLAFQGYGRKMSLDMISEINKWVMHEIRPDLIIYLKIDSSTSTIRLKPRKELTSFEMEKEDYTNRVIDGFNKIFSNSTNVVTIENMEPMKQAFIAEKHILNLIKS